MASAWGNSWGTPASTWDTVIEGGLTAAQMLKLIAAATQGNATGLNGGAVVFKGIDGTTSRITGTITTGARTVTTRDAT